MMTRGSLHLIHGFLGLPSDWNSIQLPMETKFAYDLFSAKVPSGLPQLGGWVNEQAQAFHGPRILVGYSLGGRIAFHSLMERPELWAGAVIVSAHPGLPLESEREARLQSDHQWAHRFLTEDWTALIQDWNLQPVLNSGGPPLVRNEESFSRDQLAKLMVTCSLGNQADLEEPLKKLNIPILWISGEYDAKFCTISERTALLNPQFENIKVAQAGHRVPWDQPKIFQDILEKFVKRF